MTSPLNTAESSNVFVEIHDAAEAVATAELPGNFNESEFSVYGIVFASHNFH